MTLPELRVVLGWAEAEGWNPGLDDAEPRSSRPTPKGFLLALHERQPAASVSVVRIGPAYGFLGLYICRRGLRGRGLGLAVWRAGMARMAGRSVGLDGVVAQQANYVRSGFASAHRTLRSAGVPRASPPRAAPRRRGWGIRRPSWRSTGRPRGSTARASWSAGPAPGRTGWCASIRGAASACCAGASQAGSCSRSWLPTPGRRRSSCPISPRARPASP